MIYKRRIITTLGSGVVVEILNKIAPLLIIFLAQSKLGLESFGYALFGISVMEVAVAWVNFGYSNYGIIEVQKGPKVLASVFPSVVILKSLHFLIVTLVLGFVFYLTPGYRQYFLLILSLSAVNFATVLDSVWVYAARQKLSTANLLLGGSRLLSLVLIVVFVQKPEDALLFAVLTMMAPAVFGLLTFGFTYQKALANLPSVSDVARVFKGALPFAGAVIVSILLDRLDVVYAESLGGAAGAGIYAGCVRIAHSLTQTANAILSTFFSEAVTTLGARREDRYLHISLSFWTLMMLLSPALFGVWFVGEELLYLLFGSAFAGAGNILGILIGGVCVSLVFNTFGQQVLMIEGRVRVYNYALLLSLLGASVFAYIGGKLGGFVGIAVGMLCGKLLGCSLVLWAARRFLPQLPWQEALLTLLPGLGMASFLFVFKVTGMVHQLFWGASVFALIAFLLNRKKFAGIRGA